MRDIKRIAVLLWLAVLVCGIYYTQETVYPDGNSYGWSFSGLGLLALVLFIALIQWGSKTYRLFRLWLEQQGLLDRQAKLPIRLNLMWPFVICFFFFRTTFGYVDDGTTFDMARGWGDPVAGPVCFFLIGLFLIVMQIHHILQAHVSGDEPVNRTQQLPG